MEKILDHHIRYKILVHNPLNTSQHAYQSGKSTETALHRLTCEIEDTLKNKEVLACAFIDIQGAFDNTGFGVIRDLATKKGIDQSIIGWTLNMLRGREIESKLGEVTITFAATKGCPQGGVLSPLLWLIVMDQLLSRLKDQDIDNISYADDLVILIKGKFESTVSERLQHALDITKNWCTEVGLSINPRKANCTIFTNRRKFLFTPPKLLGIEVKITKEVKYLGVILDQKLSWTAHLDHIVNKAIKVYFVCQRMVGKTWGLSPKMTLWLYTSIVRPIISYAALIWWPKTKQLQACIRLNKVQRLACLGSTGALKSSPTMALEKLLDLPPLHIHIMKMAASRAAQIKLGHHLKNRSWGHCDILNEVSLNEILTQPIDYMSKVTECDRNFSVHIPNRDYFQEALASIPKHVQVWYTDGSKTDEGTGAGVAGPKFRHLAPLGPSSTVYQTEIFAIEVCALRCMDRKYTNCEILIISDSQAALLALSSPVFSSKLTWSCYNNIKKLAACNRVTLLWIPGHAGIAGNETADRLARTGAAMKFLGPEPVIALPYNHVRERLTRWANDRTTLTWDEAAGMTVAKRFFKLEIKKLDRAVNHDRGRLRTLSWYMTGHGPFKSHLFKLGRSPDDRCRFCSDHKETSLHILLDCSAIAQIRHKHLGSIIVQEPSNEPIELGKILGFMEELNLQF